VTRRENPLWARSFQLIQIQPEFSSDHLDIGIIIINIIASFISILKEFGMLSLMLRG